LKSVIYYFEHQDTIHSTYRQIINQHWLRRA